MSDIELNKKVAREILEAMNQGNAQAIFDCFAEDGYSQTMGNFQLSGVYPRAKILELAGTMLEAFPKGLMFTITGMVAEDDKVAVEAVSKGTHISGVEYANEYHFLFTFRNGKVVSLKEYLDTDLANRVLCGGGQ